MTPDTRAPEVLGIPTVDGATLVVTFDEALDTESVPAAPGGFTLTVSRSGGSVTAPTVSGISLPSSGTVLTLTLSQAVRGGDAVTLVYAKPSTPLQDRATTPNEVANFTTGSGGVLAVENRTPSVKTVAFAGTAQTYAINDQVAGRHRLHPGGARDRDLIGPARALAHGRREHPQGALRLGHGQRHAAL